MPHLGETLNNHNTAKKNGYFLGHSDNLITLSLSQALAYKRDNNTSYFTRGSPASIYGFSCNYASFGAARAKANLFALCRVATKLDRRSREVGLFFVPVGRLRRGW